MPFDDWLDEATPADLAGLAQALDDGRIPNLASVGSVQLAGYGEGAIRFLEHFRTTDPAAIAWALRRLADERRQADDRYASVARLVWSGAADDDEAIRDTRVVLQDLFGRAQHHVLVSTLVVYNGRTVFAPLVGRLRARPDIRVEMYVNLSSETGRDEDEQADVSKYLGDFARNHWFTDVTLPAIYYDPQGRKRGAKRTKLHAKCVVVDERWVFVTSANFTEAAQERNIEAGVLLDQPMLAAALSARFEALRDAGILKRMR